MSIELIKAAQQALEALEWAVDQGGGPTCEHEAGVCFCKENDAINTLRTAIQQAEAQQPATGEPSPTHGMNLGERIKHVGGRENAQGYIEFGSVMVVSALIKQVIRDMQPATPEPVWFHKHWCDGDDIFYRPDDKIPPGSTPLYNHPAPNVSEAVDAERERCAKLCDLHSRLTWNDDRKEQSRLLATEIRRGAIHTESTHEQKRPTRPDAPAECA